MKNVQKIYFEQRKIEFCQLKMKIFFLAGFFLEREREGEKMKTLISFMLRFYIN